MANPAGPPRPWEGPRVCAGSTRAGMLCRDREVGGLGRCLHHVPDELLGLAEELRVARRCRTRDRCRQYAVEGTLPPACKNHGANIGSARYRQAAIRVIEWQVAERYAEILTALDITAQAGGHPGEWHLITSGG